MTSYTRVYHFTFPHTVVATSYGVINNLINGVQTLEYVYRDASISQPTKSCEGLDRTGSDMFYMIA